MEFEKMQEIDEQVLPLMKQFSGTAGGALYFMTDGGHNITFTAGDPNCVAEGVAEIFARLLINANITDVEEAFEWLHERVMHYYRMVMAEEARGDAES